MFLISSTSVSSQSDAPGGVSLSSLNSCLRSLSRVSLAFPKGSLFSVSRVPLFLLVSRSSIAASDFPSQSLLS